MDAKPEVYSYFDYCDYLDDIFNYFKKTIPSYSHRKFLADASIPGSTYLFRVLRKERKLSLKYVAKFSISIGHSAPEAYFFKLMVQYGNEKLLDKKDALLKELIRIRSIKTDYFLQDKKLHYFDKWYYPVIRDLIVLYNFNDDYHELARMTIPPIKPDQAKSAVMFLVNYGFITKKDNGKGFELIDPIVATSPVVNSTIISQYHKDNLALDLDVFDICDKAERSVSSVTVSINKKAFETIKFEVQEFRKKILAIARQSSAPEMVYRVGFQIMPRAKLKRGSKCE